MISRLRPRKKRLFALNLSVAATTNHSPGLRPDFLSALNEETTMAAKKDSDSDKHSPPLRTQQPTGGGAPLPGDDGENNIIANDNAPKCASPAKKAKNIQKFKDIFNSYSQSQQQDILQQNLENRLYWRIISYMRRYPDRMSSHGSYSKLGVGSEEFMRYMHCGDQKAAPSAWLDMHHVPALADAQKTIAFLNDELRAELSEPSHAPIAALKRNFALSDLEFEILATLVLIMRKEYLLRLMTVAWADATMKLPTVSFLCRLLGNTPEESDAVEACLSGNGVLRRMRLVRAVQSEYFGNVTPLAYLCLTVEQPVIDAYCGRGKTDGYSPDMTLHASAVAKRYLVADPEKLEEIEYVLSQPAARLCLAGPPHAGRRTLAVYASLHARKMPVLSLDACREFENIDPDQAEIRLSSILRQALLSDCALLLRFDALNERPDARRLWIARQARFQNLISRYCGNIIILVREHEHFLDDIFNHPTAVSIGAPDPDQSAAIWRRALEHKCPKPEIKRLAAIFAQNYALPIGSIFSVAQNAFDALAQSPSSPQPLQSHHILEEIRKSFRHDLGSLAEITVSDIPLQGVVLNEDARAQVAAILQYAQNLRNVLDVWGFRQRSPYGNALSVLFSGPPGTGKTLLACALANELGKVLYRVDLSRIVDKYIGETEKNLARIFDEAAKAQAIILFDEADSLFAKRTEVKSSNDRYANLEINFLLQKLESYNGITILTTNLSKGIDEAFRRRIRFVIDFPMPDETARIALWKRMIPPHAPLSDDIRWKWLARTFEMSGGYIRNAVLKAAIAASGENAPISMEHLVRAAADEARSMGTLMRIGDEYDIYDDDDDDI